MLYVDPGASCLARFLMVRVVLQGDRSHATIDTVLWKHRASPVVQGKRACVVGRSNIVGLPIALLLQNADATVTVVHSRTPDAKKICQEADIVIAACGRTEMVKGDWIKEGAAVIDVGINSVEVCTATLFTCCLTALFWTPAMFNGGLM